MADQAGGQLHAAIVHMFHHVSANFLHHVLLLTTSHGMPEDVLA